MKLKIDTIIKALLVLMLLSSCDISSNNNLKKSSRSEIILGEWKVDEVEIIGGYEAIVSLQNESSFYTFFPADSWKNAKGEIFEFEKGNLFKTTMLSEKINKGIDLKYSLSENLKITALVLRDSSVFNYYITIDTLTDLRMNWSFGNLMALKLIKEN